ncbi:hypothetical protein [Sphingomonas sp.]|jgi:hypothetical protein|uniref:hypothetical protein n=1 Tax=Sphingomonas sp. TaxID=28214 RepID=UPI0035C7DCE7
MVVAHDYCADGQFSSHASVPDLSGTGGTNMRMFENAASTALAIAAQALVIGVVFTTL